MKILILAAGFGTRLKEYGETTPKGLIPTSDGTLLDHVWTDIQELHAEVALVTNERFSSIYTLWSENKSITVLNDGARTPETRLGAIGDILFILDKLQWNEDLLIIPSDTYYEFSLRDFVTFAQANKGISTVLRDLKDPNLITNRLGCAVVQGERIVQFVEKPEVPPSTLAAIPFYYYPASLLSCLSDYSRSGGNLDAPGSIIPWLISQDIPVYAYVTQARTLDVGTTQDVEALSSL